MNSTSQESLSPPPPPPPLPLNTDGDATPAGASSANAPHIGLQARLLALAVAAAAVAVLFWPHDEAKTRDPGGFLFDSGGRAATLGSHLAPVTLLHFWATWCPPCITETPALQRLVRDFAGHRDFGLVMVAVADSAEKVASFLGPASDMVLYDPKWEVAHRYGTQQLPETYLLVRGKVVEKFVGMTDWDDPAVRQRLASRLEPSEGGAAAGS